MGGLRPQEQLRVGGPVLPPQVGLQLSEDGPGRRLIGEDRQPGPEFSDLRLQPLHIHVGGKGGHTQSQLLRHVQCLAADRAGGT